MISKFKSAFRDLGLYLTTFRLFWKNRDQANTWKYWLAFVIGMCALAIAIAFTIDVSPLIEIVTLILVGGTT